MRLTASPTHCTCSDERHTLRVQSGRLVMRCAACGTEIDMGPAAYEPILDAADKPAVRSAVAATAILGLLMAGVVLLHCEPSLALWSGCAFLAAGTALALVMLVRGDA